MYEKIIKEIIRLEDEAQAKHLQRFFKTKKGEYGEGDLFLGIKVPVTRSIAKKYFQTVPIEDIEKLLHDKYHEIRLLALMIMVFVYEKGDETKKKGIFDLYLKNVKFINNWDLVDLSCPKIVGEFCHRTKNISEIQKLSNKNHLWSKRISVVSCHYFIKRGEFSLILELSEKFLTDRHDLMQKAVGWMLREMGKVEISPLYEFLDKHHKTMPRTMLRYSIEKLTDDERFYYMYGDSRNR